MHVLYAAYLASIYQVYIMYGPAACSRPSKIDGGDAPGLSLSLCISPSRAQVSHTTMGGRPSGPPPPPSFGGGDAGAPECEHWSAGLGLELRRSPHERVAVRLRLIEPAKSFWSNISRTRWLKASVSPKVDPITASSHRLDTVARAGARKTSVHARARSDFLFLPRDGPMVSLASAHPPRAAQRPL